MITSIADDIECGISLDDHRFRPGAAGALGDGT
jgi:hypothetical protein